MNLMMNENRSCLYVVTKVYFGFLSLCVFWVCLLCVSSDQSVA